MVANVGSLNVRVGADISDLISGMGRAQETVKRSADSISKSAKASAKVFQDAKRQADSLLGSVDPLYAAQVRYDKELAKAQELMRAGALTANEMTKVQAGLKAQLDLTSKAYVGNAGGAARVRGGLSQLSFQVNDVAQQMAMGVPMTRIFIQQGGQVTQALQMMGGEGNKFLSFLGGPWGIALAAAAAVIVPFAAKLFETKDELGKLVDKMREQAKQAALNEQADAIWKRTIDGLTESIRKRREEQEKSLKTDIQAEQDSLNQARQELSDARQKQAAAARQLREALADLANAKASPTGLTEEDERSRAAVIQRAEAKVRQLSADLNKLNRDVDEAQQTLRGAGAAIGERNVAAKLDTVQAATDEYTRTLGTLREELVKGAITQKVFEDRLLEAKKKLDAVKEAAKGAASANREFGRQVDFAQATQIARAAGLQVNSGYRSPAQQAALFNNPAINRPGNPVAPPGASAHNGANGKWAIDIQITDGVTPGKIRKIFADQGVSLTKILKESGHFHIEGSRSEAAKAENEAERAQDKATRQQNAFEEAEDRLNGQILQAKGALVKGVEAQADFAMQRVTEEEQRNANAIKHDLAEGKYGDATSKVAQTRAEQLLVLNHSLAEEKRADIQITKREALEDKAFRLADQRMSFAIDGLKYQDDIAKTQAEHRDAQQAILDAVYKQKQYELEHEKQLAIRNGATDDEIAAIQDKIDALPIERAREGDRTNRGTMGPLEQWAASIPQTAAQVNEALQSIETQGLDGLADAIASVIDGTQSLKEAFGNLAKSIISDIIKMTLRMLIFRAISGLIGRSIPNPFGNGPADVPIMNENISLAPSGPVDLGFATGGSFTVLGRKGIDKNVMSINGVPIANVSHGERVNVGNDNDLGGGNFVVNQYNNFAGGAVTRDDLARMHSVTVAAAKSAVAEERRRAG